MGIRFQMMYANKLCVCVCVCVCVYVYLCMCVCVYDINCQGVVLALIVWDDLHNSSILVKLG